MNRNRLKNGMVVNLRNDSMWEVQDGFLICQEDNKKQISLIFYDQTMLHCCNSKFDIIAVYQTMLKSNHLIIDKCVWTRTLWDNEDLRCKLLNMHEEYNDNFLFLDVIAAIRICGCADIYTYMEDIIENGIDSTNRLFLLNPDVKQQTFKQHSIEIIDYVKEWEQRTGEGLDWHWDIEELVCFVYQDIVQNIFKEII